MVLKLLQHAEVAPHLMQQNVVLVTRKPLPTSIFLIKGYALLSYGCMLNTGRLGLSTFKPCAFVALTVAVHHRRKHLFC